MNYFEKLMQSVPVTANFVFLVLIFLFFVICVFCVGLLFGKLNSARTLSRSRQDAVKRSKAVLNGQLVEQVAPFLPNFPCSPADARFLGKPVDFIAFSGMSDGDFIDEILFIEVKTGDSKLSLREQQIKDAVLHKKIRWVEYRV